MYSGTIPVFWYENISVNILCWFFLEAVHFALIPYALSWSLISSADSLEKSILAGGGSFLAGLVQKEEILPYCFVDISILYIRAVSLNLTLCLVWITVCTLKRSLERCLILRFLYLFEVVAAAAFFLLLVFLLWVRSTKSSESEDWSTYSSFPTFLPMYLISKSSSNTLTGFLF